MSLILGTLLAGAACVAGTVLCPPAPANRAGRSVRAGIMAAGPVAPALLAALCCAPTARAADPIAGRASVIDGNTLAVGTLRVRLYGIDAPDAGQTCFDGDERDYACGRDAARALAARLGRDPVTCERRGPDDASGTLAVCRVGGADLGAWMVARGLAVADRRVAPDYAGSEDRAWGGRLGLWSGVFQPPADWRRTTRSVTASGS
ncbi:thermonuclease family protein [uncultured Methylobacterium sp.]|uniref:thermonuclease family protein n=1 Tax=uncultured Methylobacterium sp. TaxID=157278 RepID=UPI0035CC359C